MFVPWMLLLLAAGAPGGAGFGLLLSAVESVVETVADAVETAVAEDAEVSTTAAVETATEGTAAEETAAECTDLQEYLKLQFANSTADLNELTLEFVSRTNRTSYNLTTATTDLPTVLANLTTNLTVFLHGFNGSRADGAGFAFFSTAYLSNGNHSVLALDSSSVAGYCCMNSSAYVTYVGEILGEVLASSYNDGLNTTSIHLVGHGLGAHIAGYAGKCFYNSTGVRVGRITGLDPSGPCYSTLNSPLWMNCTDAEFVDVIHSNAGVYGVKEALGHVDVYPNGGSSQPGCPAPWCSHDRAVKLFVSSVSQPELFPAAGCSWSQLLAGNCSSTNTTLMGLGCSSTSSGSYCLRTGATFPYGLGADGISNSTTSNNSTSS